MPKLIISIDTDNDAFGDDYYSASQECESILGKICVEDLAEALGSETGCVVPLYDANSNRVGDMAVSTVVAPEAGLLAAQWRPASGEECVGETYTPEGFWYRWSDSREWVGPFVDEERAREAGNAERPQRGEE